MADTYDMSNANTIAKAMQDLRAKRITPDEYRAIMRTTKQQNGADAMEHLKFAAIARNLGQR